MKQVYAFYRYTILAGATVSVDVFGNFLNILSSTGALNMMIRIDGQQEHEIPVGLSVELPAGAAYTKIELRNTDVVTVTVEFSSTNGRVFDNRFVVSGSINTADILLDKALGNSSAFTTVKKELTNAASLIVAANPNRRRVKIKVPQGGSTCFIGENATITANLVAGEKGDIVDGGENIVLNTTAAVYGIVQNGAQIISVLEE